MLPEQDRAPARCRSTCSPLATRGHKVFGVNVRGAVRSEATKTLQLQAGPSNIPLRATPGARGGEAASIPKSRVHKAGENMASCPSISLPGARATLSPESGSAAPRAPRLLRERSPEHRAPARTSPARRPSIPRLPRRARPAAAPLDGSARPPPAAPAAPGPPAPPTRRPRSPALAPGIPPPGIIPGTAARPLQEPSKTPPHRGREPAGAPPLLRRTRGE